MQQRLQQESGAAASTSTTDAKSPDDFPKLPEVSAMLGSAEQTLQGLAKQAADLKLRVERAQKEKAQKMSKQKAAFEGKLKVQELGNRALVAQNAQISKQNELLKKSNADSRAHSE